MKSIEVLGISGYGKTERLKANVQKALQELAIDLPIGEVTEVDALMRSDILAIPALRINGKVVLQQTIPNVEDLKIILKNYVQSNNAMSGDKTSKSRIKNIVVPTDFSSTSKGAYYFALELAHHNNLGLKIIHFYLPEVDPAFPYYSAPSAGYLIEKSELLAKFKNHTQPPNKGGIATSVQVETELIEGLPSEGIEKLSLDPNVDLLVMGTTGEGGIMNKLFGSVSTHVAQKAHCPVLLIPNGAKFNGFQNVLYASNYQAADEIMLRQVIHFSNLLESTIHFVHVSEKYSPEDTIKEMNFEQLFQKESPPPKINVATIENKTVFDALNQYCSENDIDLLVMATSHRNFIENIFHKSMTKRMILTTRVPLLIMHFDD